jgi:hypothetical protein
MLTSVAVSFSVMVNAFFELSSNRRDIWQAGQDMQGDGRTRAVWNIALLRDLISPSYVRLLLRLRHSLGFSDQYQQLWPSATLAAPWHHVHESTLALCKHERLLKRAVEVASHSSDLMEQTEFLAVEATTEIKKTKKYFFGRSKTADCNGKMSSTSEDMTMSLWIECHHAVLLPENSSSSTISSISDSNMSGGGSSVLPVGLEGQDNINILLDVLLQTGQPVVPCLPSLWTILTTSRVCQIIALPPLVRNTLRHNNNNKGDIGTRKQHPYTPPLDYCRFLLAYCLSDNSMKNPRPNLDLDSLPLLPLADESVGLIKIMSTKQHQAISEITSMGFSVTQAKFALSRVDYDVMRAIELLTSCDASDNISGHDDASSIYIVCQMSEMKVFQMASNILLDMTLINTREVEFLTHANMTQLSNIRPFSATLVPDLLRRILPSDCFTGQPALIKSILGNEKVLLFLKDFWDFIKMHPDVLLVVVEGAAIVPSRDGLLLPLSRMSHCIVQHRAEAKLPEEIVTILESLGAHVVDEGLLGSSSLLSSIPHLFWDYVHSPSRQGVLSLLSLLLRASNQPNSTIRGDRHQSDGPVDDMFDSLTPDQREQLLCYLAESEQISTLSGNYVVNCSFSDLY